MFPSKQTVDSIKSQTEFASFLRAMQTQLTEHPNEWENNDLASFLGAAAAWVEDMDGYFLNRNEAVPSVDWRAVAHMLCAATSYE